MTTETTVWLCNDRGEQIHYFGSEFLSLKYTKVVNGAGKLHSFTARANDLPLDLVRTDYLLQVWRKPEGGSNRLDFVAFIRNWKWALDAAGAMHLIVEDNNDQNSLLARRKVAYKSGTAQAIAHDEAADDAMKRIFDENFLTPTDTDRVLPNVPGNSVSVEANETAGPELDKGFSFETVLELFQEISQETRQAGNEIFFALVVNDVDYAGGWLAFQFQTYTGQPGADRTHDTENPVIFSPEFENIEEMELVNDYRNQENAVYVAGPGVGERRKVLEVEDTDAQALSAWNRVEGFVDARDAENTALAMGVAVDVLLEARGQQRIGETRPKRWLNGRVRSTEFTLYGRDWEAGDRVTVSALGVQFDALIRVVNVQYQGGRQQVTGQVEAVL